MTRDKLKQLEQRIVDYQQAQKFTEFLLEDGSTFCTIEDPVTYLVKHGTATPQGRIAGYPRPEERMDALSVSLCELIDEGIQRGGLQYLLDGLESDEV